MVRAISEGMQTHLDSGVTTLCWCWRLIRTDGTMMGFTDHDEDVIFDGENYEAAAGFSGTAVDSDLGMSVPSMEVEGVLNSDNLTEEDLAAGLWDNADIELWRVNWQLPVQRVRIRKGTIGEVSRDHFNFMAELRGLTHELNQPVGRTYKYSCDASLGDARCKLLLEDPRYKATGTVVSLLGSDRWLECSGLDAYTTNWFTGGIMTWATGDNQGIKSEVRLHTLSPGQVQLEMWFPTPYPTRVGDTFTVKVGCDKQAGTCRYKFNNLVNFRGFPHMPAPDRIFSYPDSNAVHDGGSLYE